MHPRPYKLCYKLHGYRLQPGNRLLLSFKAMFDSHLLFTRMNADFGSFSVKESQAVRPLSLKWRVTYRKGVHTKPMLAPKAIRFGVKIALNVSSPKYSLFQAPRQ